MVYFECSYHTKSTLKGLKKGACRNRRKTEIFPCRGLGFWASYLAIMASCKYQIDSSHSLWCSFTRFWDERGWLLTKVPFYVRANHRHDIIVGYTRKLACQDLSRRRSCCPVHVALSFIGMSFLPWHWYFLQVWQVIFLHHYHPFGCAFDGSLEAHNRLQFSSYGRKR